MSRIALKCLFDDVHLEDTNSESLEAGVLSIYSDYLSMEMYFDQAEELMEVTKGLESLIVTLEQNLCGFKVNKHEAKLLYHAIEGYVGRFGFKADSIIPSIENFDDLGNSDETIQLTIESIGENLEKIWQAIMDVISKASTAIGNFFTNIFTTINRLKIRNDKLKKDAEDIFGKDPNNVTGIERSSNQKKFTVPNANNLVYRGNVEHTSIVSGLYQYLGVYRNHSDHTGVATEYFSQLFNEAKRLIGKNDNFSRVISHHKKIQLLGAHSGSVRMGNITLSLPQNSFIIGNQVVREEVISDLGGSDINQLAKIVRYQLIPHPNAKPIRDDEVNKPSDTSEAKGNIMVIHSIVEKYIEEIEKIKKTYKELSSMRQQQVRDLDELIKKADKIKVGQWWTQSNIRSFMRLGQQDLRQDLGTFTKHAFIVASSAINYGEAIIKQYRKS